MTTAIKVLGTDADYSTCDKCGKTGLKKTVVIQLEDDQIVHYGTTCASKAFRKAGTQISKSALDTEVKALYFAQTWIERGFDAKTVQMGIWDKFGFLGQVENGGIKFKMNSGNVWVEV
jgi:hypothetical protein